MNDTTAVATNGHAFDMASLALVPMEEGKPMVLRSPTTGKPLLNSAGVEVSITLLSQHSEMFRVAMRNVQMSRVPYRAQLKKEQPDYPDDAPMPLERLDEEDVDLLTAVTRGWTIDQMDGQPFPFTHQNVRKLWSDPRFVHYRQYAMSFITVDRNFFVGNAGG